ncbi:MAG: hypothetical protein ACOYM3_10560 [Terrimicrobiaceae bacterium]
MRALVLCSSLALLLMSPLKASDEIRCALVLATNEIPQKKTPPALESFSTTIKKVFGYNSLYLLGLKKRGINSGVNEWLVPSKEFFFQVTCLEQESSHYRVRIELFRAKDLLLTTEARLALDAPLYIRGPQWGDGQLILILEVR